MNTSHETSPDTRLPYEAPELRDHGTVEALTLAASAGGTDFDGVNYGAPAGPTS